MKKLFLAVAFFMLVHVAFAGGILTNSNQSVQFLRMLSRNASTQIDAVYFNPAGVIKLENGLHFAVHNQSIFQTRTIKSEYPYLNNDTYEGKITAPFFPDLFAVYKKDKLALSFMVGPVGGGGGAKYETGLPSFEKQISQLVPGLAGLSKLGFNVSEYAVDISFEGTSVFWGIQAGATYEFSEVFSAFGGVRYMPSTNTYKGSMKNISLNVNGEVTSAQTFLNGASSTATTLATQASGASTQLNGAKTNLQNAITANLINGSDPLTDPTIIGALQQFGVSTTGLTNTMAVGALGQVATTLSNTSAELTTTAATLAGTATQMGDKEVDVKQTGAGITPILGVNISPAENLNIGLRYEFKTKLTLENETEIDQLGMFPDGQKTSSDIPAILAAGVDYKFTDGFNAQLSFTNYFDKDVDWGNNIYGQKRTIDKNYWELALGVQFNLTDNFALSVGYLHSDTGVSEDYQSDFSYSNDSNSGGFGFEWKFAERFTLDAGVMYTKYIDSEKTFGEGTSAYKETYGKENILFGLGISYSIF